MAVTVLKVSAKSSPTSVARAIAGELKTAQRVELHAIGAGAVNQAIKAVAIARGITATSGKNLIAIPAFGDVKLDNEERTMIRLIVEDR